MCAEFLLMAIGVCDCRDVSLVWFGCTIRMYGYITCEIAVLPGKGAAIRSTAEALRPLWQDLVYSGQKTRSKTKEGSRSTASRNAAGEDTGESLGATQPALICDYPAPARTSSQETGGQASSPSHPGRRPSPIDRRTVVYTQEGAVGSVQHGLEARDVEYRLVPKTSLGCRV